jgi:hypothetical protein
VLSCGSSVGSSPSHADQAVGRRSYIFYVIIGCIALIVTDASFYLEGWDRDTYLGIKGQPASISGNLYSETFDAQLEQFWGFWARKMAEMLGSAATAPVLWC